MNRLDLIVSERELERLCAALTNAGAPGYTVLRHVTGRGHGGTVSEGMEFSGVGANAHVIVYCESEVLTRLREGVQPLLDYYGGVAFVADAHPL
jgi:nitrogen regulatory protein PII